MNYEELISRSIKEPGERANWDFHLRFSRKEKERLVMLTKAANHPTMAAWIRDQIFRPDLHHKIDIVLLRLDKLEEKIDAADRSRKISKQKS